MASKCAKLSKTRFMVEKFDGKSNFGLWQVQVRDILIQQGLHKALKGIKGKPADMSDEDWKEYDLQAGSTIRLCLSKEIICNVMREYSAASLWAKLESLYITKSPTGRLYLKKQLYKLRKAEDTSLADHLNEFNRIISELLNVGEVVGDEDKALILLSSLPNSYERLVSSLLYRRETIELDFVTAALLSNESRKKTASSDSEADGFLGRGGIERRKSGKCRSETIGKSKNKKVKYGECHEKGHAKKRKKNLSFPAMKQPGSVAGQKTARKCMHCEITKTPQWRAGPMGPKTLCNACGVRYRSGRLYPEYRPAASPTFIASLHSNSHNKVIEMRNMSGQKDPVPVAQFENSNPGKAPVPQFASSNLGNAPVFVPLFDDDNLGKPPEAQFASSNLGDFPPFVPPFEDEDLGKPSVPQFASSNLSNVPVFVPQFEDSNFGNAGNLGLHDLKCKVEPMG